MSTHRRQVLQFLAAGALPLFFVAAPETVSAQSPSRDLTLEVPGAGASRPRPAKPVLPMSVSLMPVGPSVVPVGSRVGARIQANNAGFGHVYIANASGKLVVLAENLPLRANRSVTLPAGGLILRAAPPTGDNVLHFLATRARFPGFAGGSTTTTPLDVQISGAELEAQIATRLSQTPRNEWGVTKTTIRVVD